MRVSSIARSAGRLLVELSAQLGPARRSAPHPRHVRRSLRRPPALPAPPPTTSTVGAISRLGRLVEETAGGAGGSRLAPHPVGPPPRRSCRPARRADHPQPPRTRGRRPSRQKTPRRPPSTASRKPNSPVATSADAKVSPANPSTGRPSKVRWDGFGGRFNSRYADAHPGISLRSCGGRHAKWWPTGRDRPSRCRPPGGSAGCGGRS